MLECFDWVIVQDFGDSHAQKNGQVLGPENSDNS